MDSYDVDGVQIVLELESGEELTVCPPFSYETLRDALDYPQEDCVVSEWVSELNLEQLGASDPNDLVASWDIPNTI